MDKIAEIGVIEPNGIRRFLYPLSVLISGKADASRLRVAELSGEILPSQALSGDGGTLVEFAVSLAPGEVRRLQVVDTADIPAIPDRILLSVDEAGSVSAAQPRFSHRIDKAGRITSVIYDNVHHLAAPATISINDVEAGGCLAETPTVGDGLGGKLVYTGEYDLDERAVAFGTTYHLTCCKSWIDVRHRVENPPAGARITFALPMAAGSGASTCDFGVGNGLYGKLQAGSIERIVWHTELSDKLNWWVGSCALASPTVRIDCQGVLACRAEIAEKAWFHWIDRDKAVAVALTRIDDSCERISVGLAADGVVKVSFFGPKTADGAPLECGICWHFLNDIPPIAAATNPASILLPPIVRVVG